MNRFNVLLAVAGISALSAGSAAALTYDTNGSVFSCGGASGCSTGSTYVQLSDGNGNSETISWLGTNSSVTPPSFLSYGYISMTVDGTAFNVPGGVEFDLYVGTDGGAATLLSTGTFANPFGGANPQVSFSPAEGIIGAGDYTVSPTSYYFSQFSAAQVTGSVGEAVPEPATWATMALGFAAVGGVGFLRGRRGRAANAA